MKEKPNKKYNLSAKGTSSEPLKLAEFGLGLMPIIFWGTAFYFVDIALGQGMHPGTIAWFRITLGFLFFALLPIKHVKHKLDKHDWISIFIQGFAWLALPLTLFAIAQQWIQASLAGMLIGAMPIFTVILASFFLKVPPTLRNTIGLYLGLIGTTVIAWPTFFEPGTQIIGVIMVLLAVFCYGFASNFSIPLTQKFGGYFLNVRVLFAASVLTAPFGIYGLFNTTHTLTSYGTIIILGCGATSLTPYAFALLTAKVGATRASSVNFLVPLVAVFIGGLSDDDISPLSLAGLAISLLGVSRMFGTDTRH